MRYFVCSFFISVSRSGTRSDTPSIKNTNPGIMGSKPPMIESIIHKIPALILKILINCYFLLKIFKKIYLILTIKTFKNYILWISWLQLFETVIFFSVRSINYKSTLKNCFLYSLSQKQRVLRYIILNCIRNCSINFHFEFL